MNQPLSDESSAVRRWYCARTQPKHEHIAAGNVHKRLGLEVFNPRLRLERATRRGVVRVIEPLFPGYIFVHWVLEEHLDAIRYLDGVSSLVHFGKQVPSVGEDIIEDLRQCFETEDPVPVEDRLRPGMEVTVADGAFLGSLGVVVRVLPARQRVQILLDFLGRTTVAEVDRRSLLVEGQSLARLMPGLSLSPSSGVGIAA